MTLSEERRTLTSHVFRGLASPPNCGRLDLNLGDDRRSGEGSSCPAPPACAGVTKRARPVAPHPLPPFVSRQVCDVITIRLHGSFYLRIRVFVIPYLQRYIFYTCTTLKLYTKLRM